MPKMKPFNAHPLTLQQARHLLIALQGHPWEALFSLALATGMRRGELLGLKWQDVTIETQTIHVRRHLWSLPTSEKDVFVEAKPKTSTANRPIPIASFGLTALSQHQTEQGHTRQQAGKDWQPHDFVFCTATGMPLRPSEVVQEWESLLHQVDLPSIRFHDLRHTTTSLLLRLEVPVRVVASILGYPSSGVFGPIDPQVLSEMQQEAMRTLHDALTQQE